MIRIKKIENFIKEVKEIYKEKVLESAGGISDEDDFLSFVRESFQTEDFRNDLIVFLSNNSVFYIADYLKEEAEETAKLIFKKWENSKNFETFIQRITDSALS